MLTIARLTKYSIMYYNDTADEARQAAMELSRSVVDGAGLMEAARREGWALHFADLDIDTSTPAGEMAANIIISGSQYERRLISQRTRDALAAKRARGERLGATPSLPLEITFRIVSERAKGRTFQSIADGLMTDGIPTARGKSTWHAATIRAVVNSDNARRHKVTGLDHRGPADRPSTRATLADFDGALTAATREYEKRA